MRHIPKEITLDLVRPDCFPVLSFLLLRAPEGCITKTYHKKQRSITYVFTYKEPVKEQQIDLFYQDYREETSHAKNHCKWLNNIPTLHISAEIGQTYNTAYSNYDMGDWNRCDRIRYPHEFQCQTHYGIQNRYHNH